MHNLDVANDPFFVDDEQCSLRHAHRVAYAIHIDHLPLRIEVRKERERGMHRFRPGAQSKPAIHTNAYNFGVEVFKSAQFSLVGGQLGGTDAAKREGDESKHNILFPSEISQMPILPVCGFERKSGSDISYFQGLCFCTISAIHLVVSFPH